MKTFAEYFNIQARYVTKYSELPVFTTLLQPLGDLYWLTLELIPRDSDEAFGRFFLICHKAYMSAASTIARGQPDDSQGVTRRACEAARIARAMKYRPENFTAWTTYQERLARWQARENNEKPKPLHPHIQDEPGNLFVTHLMEKIGMYSDASVHFTPEFMSTQTWKRERKERTTNLSLQYFEREVSEIERSSYDLAASHTLILRLFDECYDNTFVKNRDWALAINRVSDAGLSFIKPRRTT